MPRRTRSKLLPSVGSLLLATLLLPAGLVAQGVTTSSLTGTAVGSDGQILVGAEVFAVHQPSGTRYTAVVRGGGVFDIPNMRIGGPYTVRVQMLGYEGQTQSNVVLQLGQAANLEFVLPVQAVQVEGVTVTSEMDETMNPDRTGAATTITQDQVLAIPSIKRTTRDLIKTDPRNDGNYSFAGRNWLYNNISVDGSYFNNAFGLDDPAPGGQAFAEPIPFDAVEQVQVSVAPFDIREGGFTGANVNTVTKSGTNTWKGTFYTFFRNESLLGNSVSGNQVVANPDLSFNQTGVSFGGPLVENKLFLFANAELERRDDPGSNFVASSGGVPGFGESRVDGEVMDMISQRLRDVYGYETGPYEGFVHETDNNKALVKLDWNVNDNNNLTFRWNYLDGLHDLPPHPFVLSANNSGRGPNSTSLPFKNAGYRIENKLNSLAAELNSRGSSWSNRFFASWNSMRDERTPFSVPFPTIEIAEGGITYTTAGHEPFSIHNQLETDIIQITNNFTYFTGRHSITVGGNFERWNFFNSFNIFRNGVFFLPAAIEGVGSTFSSIDEFMDATDPNREGGPIDFGGYVGSGPFKGEIIDALQFSLYAQDEFQMSDDFRLTFGLRMDVPVYSTEPVDNPFSRSLTALDQFGNPETVDQSQLPATTPLFSPRVGFNWDVTGDRRTQLRGGSGIFTGRIPFVWYGNAISNPGANPNLFPDAPPEPTRNESVLQQSFDLNAMATEFKFPQVWTTDLAIDQQLGQGLIGTFEVIYGKDINAIFMRNSDLVPPVGTLADGRPYYGGAGNNELNPDGGAGIYVIDNTDEGWNLNVTAQLRKTWQSGLQGMIAYAYNDARNNLKSTEIASVLWQSQPVRGNPNLPELSYSEFGPRNRITAAGSYPVTWNERLRTTFGLYFEAAEGGVFFAGGGNRFSFTYAGDVNGDGQGGNDLIYIPRNESEIRFDPRTNEDGSTTSAAQQWQEFNSFIEQDKYLSKNRGTIAERMGLLGEWYHTLDLRVLQDFVWGTGANTNTIQVSVDVLNFMNLLSSNWGVRKTPNAAALSPLAVTRTDEDGEPYFNFNGIQETFIDNPTELSRWRIQLGLRYLLN